MNEEEEGWKMNRRGVRGRLGKEDGRGMEDESEYWEGRRKKNRR